MTNVRSVLNAELLNKRVVEMMKVRIGLDAEKKKQLSKLLGVKKHTLYKRLSGHSHFTAIEIALLMNHFQFSFDELVLEQPFYAKVFLHSQKNPVQSVEDFVLNLLQLFESLKPIEDCSVTYASAEVPVFYYFLRARVGCFKLFNFARHVWRISSMQKAKCFQMELFSPSLIDRLGQLWDTYKSMSTVEIWSPQIWMTTLNQVEYFVQHHLFKTDMDALNLLAEIEMIIDDMSSFVIKGNRTGQEDSMNHFMVYNNSLLHSNNIIHVKKKEKVMLFITHDNPNYLFSEEEELVGYTNVWMNKLKESAQVLNSEQDVETFFALTRKRIQELKNDILNKV